MSVTYVVARGGSLVVELWIGTITHRELIEHEKGQLQDNSIKPGAIVLADCRRASFSETTPDTIHELPDLYLEPDLKVGFSRVAIVMQGSDFDTARTFEDLARPMGIDIITFSNFDVACTWLGIAPAEVTELIAKLEAE